MSGNSGLSRIVTKEQPPIVGRRHCLMCDSPLPGSKTKPRRFCPDGPGVACRQGFQRLKAEQGTLVICRNRSGTFRVRPGVFNAGLIFTSSSGLEFFVRGYEVEFPRAPRKDRKERLPQRAILDKYGKGTMGGVGDGRLCYYTKRTKSGYRVRFRDWSKVIAAAEACHLARARRFEFSRKKGRAK